MLFRAGLCTAAQSGTAADMCLAHACGLWDRVCASECVGGGSGEVGGGDCSVFGVVVVSRVEWNRNGCECCRLEGGIFW